jgi:putative colanic acid biosynthesis acetyltransferase WcaF
MNGFRIILLRLFGAKIGRNVNVRSSVKIWAPWNLEIGNNVGFGDGVHLYSMNKIFIDDYCVVSEGAQLCCGTHNYNSINFELTTAPIRLNKWVWLCTNAFVGPGVTLPEGTVLGAVSVIVKSIDKPWGVYGGNPVKRIKDRVVLIK